MLDHSHAGQLKTSRNIVAELLGHPCHSCADLPRAPDPIDTGPKDDILTAEATRPSQPVHGDRLSAPHAATPGKSGEP
jgi:hypothetical protein